MSREMFSPRVRSARLVRKHLALLDLRYDSRLGLLATSAFLAPLFLAGVGCHWPQPPLVRSGG